MSHSRNCRAITLAIVFTLASTQIAGCASQGHGMAQGDEDCSTAKSAGAGALIGGLIGAAVGGKKDVAKGAAVGALAGAFGCMAMNYHAKQVRSAKEVNQQYVEENKKLPADPTVTNYSLSAPGKAVRGKPVSVNSSITVVDGRRQAVNSVEEKLYIVNDDGERKQIKTKESDSGMKGGGEYSNSFTFTPPSGVAEGNYRLESEVYVNDALAKTAKSPITLARNADGTLTLAFSE